MPTGGSSRRGSSYRLVPLPQPVVRRSMDAMTYPEPARFTIALFVGTVVVIAAALIGTFG